MADLFVDRRLERVIVGGCIASELKNRGSDTDKRNPLGGIGHRVGGQSIYRFRGAGQGGLIIAPYHGKVSAGCAGVGEGEQVALVLGLSLKIIMLGGRLFKTRI